MCLRVDFLSRTGVRGGRSKVCFNVEEMMKINRLRVEHMKNPMGIDVEAPVVSWTLRREGKNDGERQLFFRVEALGHLGTRRDSGRLAGDSMQYRLESGFLPRERVEVRVTVWDDKGTEAEAAASFEMGLRSQDWKALWINPELAVPAADGMRPASYLRKKFFLSAEDRAVPARLYATAHGTYQVRINGRLLEGHVLAPGTSEYKSLLQYQTYDVTDFLQIGENEITVSVGNGWWRGTVTYEGIRNGYGERVAFLAQLECGGRTVCVTDESWEASQEGPLRDTDLMQGEVYDARK